MELKKSWLHEQYPCGMYVYSTGDTAEDMEGLKRYATDNGLGPDNSKIVKINSSLNLVLK